MKIKIIIKFKMKNINNNRMIIFSNLKGLKKVMSYNREVIVEEIGIHRMKGMPNNYNKINSITIYNLIIINNSLSNNNILINNKVIILRHMNLKYITNLNIQFNNSKDGIHNLNAFKSKYNHKINYFKINEQQFNDRIFIY